MFYVCVSQLGQILNSSEALMEQVALIIGFSHDPVSPCND